MRENLEIETKVMISKQIYHHLCATCEFETTMSHYNHYYQAATQPSDVALRIRRNGSSFLFTLKKKEGNYHREYEVELPNDDINHPLLQPIYEQFNIVGPFTSLGHSSTVRSVLHIKSGEICVDHSIFDWGDDFEIEFEAIDQDPNHEKEFMRWLRFHHVVYTPSVQSKMQRALNPPVYK
mgnify:CR=1 FL=1